MAQVRLNSDVITDWPSFHAECQHALGFPDFYGANMDAWIDCMSSLQDEDGMIGVRLEPDELLLLEVPRVEDLRARLPEVVSALVECTAFVNRERYPVPRIALLLT